MRLAIINLFYPPDVAPSAHFASSLAEHRAALGDEVTVVTGRGAYLGGRSAGQRVDRNGGLSPRVVRVWTPALGKASHLRRLADYLSFLLSAMGRLATMPPQDVVIALTSPPYVEVAAVAHRLVHPGTRVIVWSHDVYPDAAEEYGTIARGGAGSRALRATKRWLFRRVDHVVALDRAMLRRQLSQYADDGRPGGTVIPNWEPAALFPSGAHPARAALYHDPALAERFVVLYLGNLGYGHPIETMVEAAARLRDEGVAFLFVGGGVRYPEMQRHVAERNLGNVLVLRDYVSKEETPGVLAGAECALISLDEGSLGIMSPCKLHPALGMGVPVVYAGPAGTNVDEAIERYECGFSLRQGDVDGLVGAIRSLRADPGLAATLSDNARKAFEDAYCDERTLPQFDRVLETFAE